MVLIGTEKKNTAPHPVAGKRAWIDTQRSLGSGLFIKLLQLTPYHGLRLGNNKLELSHTFDSTKYIDNQNVTGLPNIV